MLKAVQSAEEWGGLSADVQAHYAMADDGTYRLEVSPAGGFEFADTQGLKAALQKERAERAKSVQGLKSLTERVGDMDLEAARVAMEKVAKMGEWDPEQKLAEAKTQFEKQMTEKYEKLTAAAAAKRAKEVEESNAQLDSALAQLRQKLIASDAVTAISEAGGSVELLLPIVERTTRMRRSEDGRFTAEVVDTAGTPRLSPKSGVTEPMSVKELVEELRADEKYARAFDGSGAKGSGSTRSAAGGGSSTKTKTVKKGDLSGMASNLEAIAKGDVKIEMG